MAAMSILAVIGAVTGFFFLVDNLWSVVELVTSYLSPYFQPQEEQTLSKRFGTWAVVTGSTDGIGKQYALELAKRGINVILISRNLEKLNQVASHIESSHGVKSKVVVADFSQGAAVYQHIADQLHGFPIGILVNNVGSQYEYPMRVCEASDAKTWEIINVNVGAATFMCKLVLPSMVERGRGAIVNVSSGSENQPVPLMSVYGASKAYVSSFTKAIRAEYSHHGIFVQQLSPYFVSTKMNQFSASLMQGNLLVPDVETYTRHAVASLGRVHQTTGYWLHGIQCCFSKMSPEWIRMRTIGAINIRFRNEYKRNVKAAKKE